MVFVFVCVFVNCISIKLIFAGLSCHSCNSIYDSRCGDPYDAYTVELVDCEQVMLKMMMTIIVVMMMMTMMMTMMMMMMMVMDDDDDDDDGDDDKEEEKTKSLLADPCCALKYYPAIEACDKVRFQIH